ncbi:hypothetical protein B0H21DRAFT_820851 [Amylocystis lapponica]|nr:hypothetical protein B0H21DRAFT_820851 [Amylocystis lapponica]
MPSEDNFEGDDDEDLKSDPVSQMDMKAHTVHVSAPQSTRTCGDDWQRIAGIR